MSSLSGVRKYNSSANKESTFNRDATRSRSRRCRFEVNSFLRQGYGASSRELENKTIYERKCRGCCLIVAIAREMGSGHMSHDQASKRSNEIGSQTGFADQAVAQQSFPAYRNPRRIVSCASPCIFKPFSSLCCSVLACFISARPTRRSASQAIRMQ